MEQVLILIGNPDQTGDVAPAAELAHRALAAAGGVAEGVLRLGPDAAEFAFAGLSPEAAQTAVRAALAGRPFDLAALPRAGRRKRLLVADMDSTIIGCECIDELADFAGLRAKVAGITERAMRGELDFKSALQARVAMLSGLPESVLEQTYRERVRLNPGARELVQTMRRNGAMTALVSGGFTYFTSRVREACGFAIDQGNELLLESGRLTGEVRRPILDSGAKLAMLERLRQEGALDATETLAVGDGANDLPMVQAAGLGVAYRAKPLVAASARARIDHGNLTALLYLQGYRREEFVT
ncbi:MAG: phosphoserine phosphatase SerB [Alphaproteobacteria bacterium]|nr:phosphoserine phosphatase SerB [Alphaproteobacteria bacterium]